jgi:hypothetical protein
MKGDGPQTTTDERRTRPHTTTNGDEESQTTSLRHSMTTMRHNHTTRTQDDHDGHSILSTGDECPQKMNDTPPPSPSNDEKGHDSDEGPSP